MNVDRPLTGRRVGWIGTGVMGAAMAARLRTAGADLAVTTRTRARAEGLLSGGATWVDHPNELIRDREVIFTMLGFPSDVEEVFLGSKGLIPSLAEGGEAPLIIDTTTSSPALAMRIGAEAAERGAIVLDAPVSGGDVGARDGTLSIMVGGAADGLERALPYLSVLGRTIELQGPSGSGQHTKMVNQILIATNMIGVCEGLLYARQAGLDPERVLASVGGGAAGSWSVANLAPRILRGDFAPGFYVEHFIKDLGIALEEAERLELTLPGLTLARELYEEVRVDGHGRSGTQALYLALAKRSGVS